MRDSERRTVSRDDAGRRRMRIAVVVFQQILERPMKFRILTRSIHFLDHISGVYLDHDDGLEL